MCVRLLKLAKVNADRKVTASQKGIDVPMRLAEKAVSLRNLAAMAIAIASQTVTDVLKQVAAVKVANRKNLAAMVTVVPTENADPKGVVPMASRRAMANAVPKAKAVEVRCLGSLNCSTAITTDDLAERSSIGSKKSSTNWIATRTANLTERSCSARLKGVRKTVEVHKTVEVRKTVAVRETGIVLRKADDLTVNRRVMAIAVPMQVARKEIVRAMTGNVPKEIVRETASVNRNSVRKVARRVAKKRKTRPSS